MESLKSYLTKEGWGRDLQTTKADLSYLVDSIDNERGSVGRGKSIKILIQSSLGALLLGGALYNLGGGKLLHTLIGGSLGSYLVYRAYMNYENPRF